MTRIASIYMSLTVAEGVQLVYGNELEVSLDCPNCKRNRRTVIFHIGNTKGCCTPRRKCGNFPGQIIHKQKYYSEQTYFVSYKIRYEYEPFIDLKSGDKSVGLPTWERIHFTLVCPNCSRLLKRSIQNNIVRPWSCYCECGRLMYTEEEEIPRFLWSEVE
jgi:uncharacterized protein YbaR (Trm112 family)